MEILTFILFGSEYTTDKGKRKFDKGQTTTLACGSVPTFFSPSLSR